MYLFFYYYYLFFFKKIIVILWFYRQQSGPDRARHLHARIRHTLLAAQNRNTEDGRRSGILSVYAAANTAESGILKLDRNPEY